MIHRLKTKGKNPEKALEEWRKIPSDKAFLRRREKLVCCKNKKADKERAKFGTSRCDSYGFSYRVATILTNNLFQYLADAKRRIVRNDWDIIEKHAQAIRDFADADSWDFLSKEKGIKTAYLTKEKNWKQAMSWLAENWKGLWW